MFGHKNVVRIVLTGAHVITDGHKDSGKVCYSPMNRDFVLIRMMDAGKYGDGLVKVILSFAL